MTIRPALDHLDAPRGRIYDSILETVGHTPLVRLNRIAEQNGAKATILAKLEFFNPLSSIKDRIALSMIETAEKEGKLKEGAILVEPTSGNTGIALAFVCAAKGYKLILTMPESMSLERRKMLKILGAELELTPAPKGMRGAIEKAEEIVASNPNAILLQQFKNPANPWIHTRTTAEEVWADTDGKVDVLVREAIDEIITISNATAFAVARDVNKLDGIPAGISSGATIAAALEVAKRPEMEGKTIVVIVASCAERYLSTDLFSE